MSPHGQDAPSWPREFPWNRCWLSAQVNLHLPLGEQLMPSFEVAAYGSILLEVQLSPRTRSDYWIDLLSMLAARAGQHMKPRCCYCGLATQTRRSRSSVSSLSR
jgi:hypothetical protein